jgi:hypothetical protein
MSPPAKNLAHGTACGNSRHEAIRHQHVGDYVANVAVIVHHENGSHDGPD